MAARGRGKRPHGRASSGAAAGRRGGGVVFSLRDHAGKWVATQRGRILATDTSLEHLEAILDEMGVGSDVVLTKVPKSGDFAL